MNCTVKDCPAPRSESFHVNVCGHAGQPTHMHWPKKGMGGRNPKSKIRAVACYPCHDGADNFGGSHIVHSKDGERYIGWRGFRYDKREILWDVPLGPNGYYEGESDGSIARTAVGDSAARVGDKPSSARQAATGTAGNQFSIDGGSAHSQLAPSPLREQRAEFGELTFDQWREVWGQVAATARNSPWWVGDAFLWAEDRWPESLWQVADEIAEEAGLSIQTIGNRANVCKAFPPAERRRLSFSSHAAVYAAVPPVRTWILDKAEDGLIGDVNAFVRQLRASARAGFGLAHVNVERRWTMAELRAAADAFFEYGRGHSVIWGFIDWLEENDD